MWAARWRVGRDFGGGVLLAEFQQVRINPRRLLHEDHVSETIVREDVDELEAVPVIREPLPTRIVVGVTEALPLKGREDGPAECLFKCGHDVARLDDDEAGKVFDVPAELVTAFHE